MSRFAVLRVDHYDPALVGIRNRRLYTLYGILPGLTLVLLNITTMNSEHYGIVYLITVVTVLSAGILITVQTRKNNAKLKPIGEVEITQSTLKKRIGDSLTEISYMDVREMTLTKHMPATRMTETRGHCFSYILKIESIDGEEDTFVVADRSLDQNQKISVLNTLKTLKKIVRFEIKINV